MIPAGYMLKLVVLDPEWLEPSSVKDIYSLSSCISRNLADHLKFATYNGYWLFDSPGVILELANREQIDISGMTLFYYEIFEEEYDEESKKWSQFFPNPSFSTNVLEAENKLLAGFDIATYSNGNGPECSPLSCNLLAKNISVNEHCLLSTFAETRHVLESGRFKECEPGPLRIIAVYTVGYSNF